MKKVFWAIVLGVVAIGCSSTKSIVTEYDAAGHVIKVTETGNSIVSDITESTRGKTVVAWESGWAAYISASTATQQDPTPTLKLFAGKTDKGVVSALPDQENWDGIASAINATKYELYVSTSGVESKSAETDVLSEIYTPEVPENKDMVKSTADE